MHDLITPLVRPYFAHIVKGEQTWSTRTEQVQRLQLAYMLHKGRATLFGQENGLAAVDSYENFRTAVPVRGYEDIRAWVMRMVSGESDILWPGRTLRFAQSSGTTGGKSKYIPVTDDSLKSNHYAGTKHVVANYLNLYRQSHLFGGKAFILGGSYANELSLLPGVRVGDLSANLIDNMNPMAELFRVPSKKIALMEDWTRKLPALVEASLHENITNISGVPSWFLTVLKGVIEKAGARNIHEVWPNLEVFFHGGISFMPYRSEYEAITDTSRMRYIETYNASEGFFAVQDTLSSPAMLLLVDDGIFYEFVPVEQIDEPFPEARAAWQVAPGEIYAMVITARNGLWRYAIGDTVRIETVNPLRITIAGRTKTYINAFGEEVMVHNTDAALARACETLKCSVLNYHAAPVYTHGARKGHHQWVVEWDTPPADPDEFARLLDSNLQQENSDYQAKRTGGIFLDPIEVVTAPAGLFDRWLSSTGKLGGQRKIPRLSNDRKIMDQLLGLVNSE